MSNILCHGNIEFADSNHNSVLAYDIYASDALLLEDDLIDLLLDHAEYPYYTITRSRQAACKCGKDVELSEFINECSCCGILYDHNGYQIYQEVLL